MRRSISAVFVTSLAALIGCGGSDDAGVKQTSNTPEAGLDRAKAVVTRYVNEDVCALMSDRYAGEGYRSADEGRAACEADPNPGLSAGEYKIKTGSVAGSKATVILALNGGGTRTYTLVRGGPSGWQIDGFEENQRGVVGDTFTFRDSYEQDGNPVNVNLRVTVMAVKDNVPAPEFFEPGAGKRWVRVRVRIRSRGKESFSQSTDDFKLIDASGQRYSSDGAAFQPSLGNGGVSLSEGDVVVGYLGFKVPRRAQVKAIRLSSTFVSRSPLEWRVK